MRLAHLIRLVAKISARTILKIRPGGSGVAGPCRIWVGARNKDGYGTIRDGDRILYVHRLVARLGRSKAIPRGHETDHRCFRRACVAELHLEVVTGRENRRRQARRR